MFLVPYKKPTIYNIPLKHTKKVPGTIKHWKYKSTYPKEKPGKVPSVQKRFLVTLKKVTWSIKKTFFFLKLPDVVPLKQKFKILIIHHYIYTHYPPQSNTFTISYVKNM